MQLPFCAGAGDVQQAFGLEAGGIARLEAQKFEQPAPIRTDRGTRGHDHSVAPGAGELMGQQ